MTINQTVTIPIPYNEVPYNYHPSSTEKETLKQELARLSNEKPTIPLIIDGKKITTTKTNPVVMPHRHQHQLATCCHAEDAQITQAINAANKAHLTWSRMHWEDRASIFLRAAELLAGPWRARINAATMLNQSKTAHQADIDAACELIDFWRYNVHYAEHIYKQQPYSPHGDWNRMEYRPLEGFVLAITPFNFTSIAANLATAPALMGNTVLWKPSCAAELSAYYTMELLKEAGLPDGVINFIPGDGKQVADMALRDPSFAGLHFTGSTQVFRALWKQIGNTIDTYKNYPRLVGETGGKDFIVAHSSANEEALLTAIVRGAFEYQGQKCSAVSRIYIPETLWQSLKPRLIEEVHALSMGDITDFTHFGGAVIHQTAWNKHKAAIETAKQASDATIIAGGITDDSVGWFVSPTVIETSNPFYETMTQELFGPIVTCFPYADDDFDSILQTIDQTSPYGLTGAIFANDKTAIIKASHTLRYSAGNFYINDKPTGAVVGQQPFGGGRASGTNDKAGSAMNLERWISPRTIKENFAPATSIPYPYMKEC